MAYSRHGIFGGGSREYEVRRLKKTEGMDAGRISKNRVGVLGLDEHIAVGIVLIFGLSMTPFIGSVLQVVLQLIYGVSLGEISVDYAAAFGYVTTVATVIVVAFPLSLVFQWDGTASKLQSTVGFLSVTSISILVQEGQVRHGVIAFLVNFSIVCARMGWIGTVGSYIKFFAMIFLVSSALATRVWLSLVPMGLWSLELGLTKFAKVTHQGIIDQTLKKCRKVGSSIGISPVKQKAWQVFPVNCENVPDELLYKFLYRENILLHTAEFRAWALVGDAAMKMAIAIEGKRLGRTVAESNVIVQSQTTRSFLGGVVSSSDHAKSKLLEVQGNLSNAVCAEVAEVLIGLSYTYTYGGGVNRSWSTDLTQVLQSLCDHK